MPDDVFQLFDDYAARYARGERPEASEYLRRAGRDADELARLLDGFLSRAPAPAADAETVAVVGGWMRGETPLLALRVERGLTLDVVVDALVDALVRRLGLDRARRARVRRRYDELERGLLDPGGVDSSVWEALAATLRARVTDLVAWRPAPPPPAAAGPALFRADAVAPAAAAARSMERLVIDEPEPGPQQEPEPGEAEPAEVEPDEVDRLFGTG